MKDRFTCVNYTSETMDFLKKLGIVSYQVVGTDKNNESLAHSWVGIPFAGTILHFEPQQLVFFNPKDNYVNVVVVYNSYR